MFISFSTNCKFTAKEYLSKNCYSYLSSSAKDFILKNLDKYRIQDPYMYPNPKIEIKTQEDRDKLMMIIQGSQNE